MKVTTVKSFPPHANSGDNPSGSAVSFAASSISGKIVCGAGLMGMFTDMGGDSKRVNNLIFDFVHIATGSTDQIRQIDHIIDDSRMKLTESVLDTSGSVYALKRLAYTDARLHAVAALGDPIRVGMLNEAAITTNYVSAPLIIPMNRNHECIPFLVDGTAKAVEVMTSPSIYPE